jgi:hypothetical protein
MSKETRKLVESICEYALWIILIICVTYGCTHGGCK